MLVFCSMFADVNDVLFNPGKPHYIKFCNNMSVVQYEVVLQETSLEWVDRVVHLDHVLIMINDNVSDIRRCCDSFSKQINLFCARFDHLPGTISCKLLQSFCLSFYCSQLSDLNHKELQYLDTGLRKVSRRRCNLLYMKHSAILPFFMDGNDYHALLRRRIHSFAHSCLFCVNTRTAFILLITCNSLMHNFGYNLLHIIYSLKNVTIPPTASVF